VEGGPHLNQTAIEKRKRDLLRAQAKTLAREVSTTAYARYSKFKVGACVITDDGRLFAGCNVENVNYTLTLHAEHHAIGSAIAAGAKRVIEIVIYTPTPNTTPPCGSCRQTIYEFARDCLVIGTCEGEEKKWRLSRLLPDAFGPHNLRK
jgi:cytidine deaminase